MKKSTFFLSSQNLIPQKINMANKFQTADDFDPKFILKLNRRLIQLIESFKAKFLIVFGIFVLY